MFCVKKVRKRVQCSCYGVPAVLVGFVMRLLKISLYEPDHEILYNEHIIAYASIKGMDTPV